MSDYPGYALYDKHLSQAPMSVPQGGSNYTQDGSYSIILTSGNGIFHLVARSLRMSAH